MHYVTFTIKEKRDGQFVLLLRNHLHKKVYEKFRSKNLNAVFNRLKEGMKLRSDHMTVLNAHVAVLEFFDRLEIKYPDAYEETFPENWNDPLDLYGQYRWELDKPGFDLIRERANLMVMLKKHSPEWIWQNRLKLVAESILKSES
jgi:hypothetical protein